MHLGCYGSLDKAKQLKAAGFDFLEVDAHTVLRGDLSTTDWQPPDANKLAVPIEVASGLLPDDQLIVGPERDTVQLQNHMQRMAKRAQQLGIRFLIFDSGRARYQPQGVTAATAWDHLEEFVRMAAQICAHHGQTLPGINRHPVPTFFFWDCIFTRASNASGLLRFTR